MLCMTERKAADFLYKHGDLTYSAAFAAIELLAGNGFRITHGDTPATQGVTTMDDENFRVVGAKYGRKQQHGDLIKFSIDCAIDIVRIAEYVEIKVNGHLQSRTQVIPAASIMFGVDVPHLGDHVHEISFKLVGRDQFTALAKDSVKIIVDRDRKNVRFFKDETLIDVTDKQAASALIPDLRLFSNEEKGALLTKAENLWRDLQKNDLGGFSNGNRPFYIFAAFRDVIETFGGRNTGYRHSHDEIQAHMNVIETEVKKFVNDKDIEK